MKSTLTATLLCLLLPLTQSLPLSSPSSISQRSAQGDGKAAPIPLLEIGDLTPFGIVSDDESTVSHWNFIMRSKVADKC